VAELLGKHRYQLDAKGRIALPGKFREAFADGVYLTLGQDECLWAFPKAEFDRVSEEIDSRPLSDGRSRAYARMFYGSTERMDLDGQGRLVIPQKLRSEIGLARDAVVMGLRNRLEIWSAPAWERYEAGNAGSYRSGALSPHGT